MVGDGRDKRKEMTRNTRGRWVDDIKLDPGETRWGGMD
jgi:hypothetical protein